MPRYRSPFTICCLLFSALVVYGVCPPNVSKSVVLCRTAAARLFYLTARSSSIVLSLIAIIPCTTRCRLGPFYKLSKPRTIDALFVSPSKRVSRLYAVVTSAISATNSKSFAHPRTQKLFSAADAFSLRFPQFSKDRTQSTYGFSAKFRTSIAFAAASSNLNCIVKTDV